MCDPCEAKLHVRENESMRHKKTRHHESEIYSPRPPWECI